MKRELVRDFLEQWKPLPLEKGEDCPTDAVLVALAKGNGQDQWEPHLEACEQCRMIVNLLQETSKAPGKNLSVFLDRAREVSGAVLGKPTSFPESLRHGLGLQRILWGGVYATTAAALVLAVGWGWINRAGFPFIPHNEARISLEADPYQSAVELLQSSIKEAASSRVPADRRAALSLEIKASVRKVDLKPAQALALKQQADTLQELFRQQYLTDVAQQTGELRRSAKATELYLTYARYDPAAAYGEKSDVVIPGVVDPHGAILTASREIDVEEQGGILVVKPRVANRDPEDTPWVRDAMSAFARQSQTAVKFKSAKGVMSFTPAGNASFRAALP